MDPKEPKALHSDLAEWLATRWRVPLFLLQHAAKEFFRRWPYPDFRGLVLIVGSMGLLVWWAEFREPSTDRRELSRLLQGNCWITYDPIGWDPYLGLEPTLGSIQRDLRRIRAAGFTGIVTSGSRGSFAKIPRLAKAEGLAVIMGVWNPADLGELQRAIRQRAFVDAYCVGHNGLNKPNGYTMEELEKGIILVQRRTGRPVTTSEEVRLYEDPALARLGDWLFPDVHISILDASSWRFRAADLESQIESSVELAQAISAVATEMGRPVMLKIVTCPWKGIEGASPRRQQEFFEIFLEALRSPELALPARPSLVFHSAFDLPWKAGYPFYPWDSYTGLLAPDGTPRPAAGAITARCQ